MSILKFKNANGDWEDLAFPMPPLYVDAGTVLGSAVALYTLTIMHAPPVDCAYMFEIVHEHWGNRNSSGIYPHHIDSYFVKCFADCTAEVQGFSTDSGCPVHIEYLDDRIVLHTYAGTGMGHRNSHIWVRGLNVQITTAVLERTNATPPIRDNVTHITYVTADDVFYDYTATDKGYGSGEYIAIQPDIPFPTDGKDDAAFEMILDVTDESTGVKHTHVHEVHVSASGTAVYTAFPETAPIWCYGGTVLGETTADGDVRLILPKGYIYNAAHFRGISQRITSADLRASTYPSGGATTTVIDIRTGTTVGGAIVHSADELRVYKMVDGERSKTTYSTLKNGMCSNFSDLSKTVIGAGSVTNTNLSSGAATQYATGEIKTKKKSTDSWASLKLPVGTAGTLATTDDIADELANYSNGLANLVIPIVSEHVTSDARWIKADSASQTYNVPTGKGYIVGFKANASSGDAKFSYTDENGTAQSITAETLLTFIPKDAWRTVNAGAVRRVWLMIIDLRGVLPSVSIKTVDAVEDSMVFSCNGSSAVDRLVMEF